ncbi:MAG: cupredoxin family copper-binding protein [Chloroflexi bacterium]|nr:cupredoxin family copper-binding protein [Chloroflexota bacterium]
MIFEPYRSIKAILLWSITALILSACSVGQAASSSGSRQYDVTLTPKPATAKSAPLLPTATSLLSPTATAATTLPMVTPVLTAPATAPAPTSTLVPVIPIAAPTTAPAPAPTQAQSAPTGPVQIKIIEPPFKPVTTWHYDPPEITVKVGTKITWVNTGAVVHTVTATDGKSFDSGDIKSKETFSFTFTAAGTFPYHCHYHPWMKGTIVVVP